MIRRGPCMSLISPFQGDKFLVLIHKTFDLFCQYQRSLEILPD